MTRKRARKILMSIGTSRNHANWGLTAKPRWKTNAGVVEDTLTIALEMTKMPDEYISREAALTALQDSDLFNTTERQLRAIRELPAADVAEVVHGKWVDNGIPDSILNGCSVCGFTCGSSSFFYCPKCGARMDGGVGSVAD